MPTEEQLVFDSNLNVGKGTVVRVGQKLTIPNRYITHIGFWLSKTLNPAASLYFGFYRVSDGGLITEELWGLADDLDGTETYKEVALSSPQTINEEVYMVVRATEQSDTDYARVAFENSDIKADELACLFTDTWITYADRDMAYIYTYDGAPPAAGFGRGVAAVAQALGV